MTGLGRGGTALSSSALLGGPAPLDRKTGPMLAPTRGLRGQRDVLGHEEDCEHVPPYELQLHCDHGQCAGIVEVLVELYRAGKKVVVGQSEGLLGFKSVPVKDQRVSWGRQIGLYAHQETCGLPGESLVARNALRALRGCEDHVRASNMSRMNRR